MSNLKAVAKRLNKDEGEAVVYLLNTSDTIIEASKKAGVTDTAFRNWMNKLDIRRRYEVATETKNAHESD